MKTKTIFCLSFILLAFTLLSFGQESDQEFKEVRKTFSMENIEELETEIEFPVGGIILNATPNNTVKGIFRYKKDQWEPEIRFDKQGNEGHLEISAEKRGKLRDYDESDQNIWGITLSKNVLHDLDLEMGAGKSKMNLEGCRIKSFEFAMGAGEAKINLRNSSVKELEIDAAVGEATIDLSGKWRNDMDASITGGLGEITLKLPKDIGIKLDIHGILGEVNIQDFSKKGNTYTNDLYGKTENTLYIDLTGGLGEITIETVEY